MVDRYLSPKFGVNPQRCQTMSTDGRTDDGRPGHDSSSHCLVVAQSKDKNVVFVSEVLAIPTM